MTRNHLGHLSVNRPLNFQQTWFHKQTPVYIIFFDYRISHLWKILYAAVRCFNKFVHSIQILKHAVVHVPDKTRISPIALKVLAFRKLKIGN